MRPKKKSLVAVTSDCHHRIKIEAARQGVQLQDLATAAFDYGLPLLEKGKLAIPKSVLQPSTAARKASRKGGLA